MSLIRLRGSFTHGVVEDWAAKVTAGEINLANKNRKKTDHEKQKSKM